MISQRRSASLQNISLLGLSNRVNTLSGAYDRVQEHDAKDLEEPNVKFNMNALREAEKEEIKLSQTVLENQYDSATNDLR